MDSCQRCEAPETQSREAGESRGGEVEVVFREQLAVDRFIFIGKVDVGHVSGGDWRPEEHVCSKKGALRVSVDFHLFCFYWNCDLLIF